MEDFETASTPTPQTGTETAAADTAPAVDTEAAAGSDAEGEAWAEELFTQLKADVLEKEPAGAPAAGAETGAAGAKEAQEGADEPLPKDAPAGAAEAEKTPAGTYAVKHLDKTEYLTPEQMIPLAQKGKDYDYVRQQRDQLDGALKSVGPYMEALQRSMLLNGYVNEAGKPDAASAQRYLQDFARSMDEMEMAAYKNAGYSDADARGLLANKRDAEAWRQQQAARQVDAGRTEELRELLRVYPQLEQVPAAAVQLAKQHGLRLLPAMMLLERQQAAIAQRQRETREKNAQTAVGSAKGNAKGAVNDDFLSGWADGLRQ